MGSLLSLGLCRGSLARRYLTRMVSVPGGGGQDGLCLGVSMWDLCSWDVPVWSVCPARCLSRWFL